MKFDTNSITKYKIIFFNDKYYYVNCYIIMLIVMLEFFFSPYDDLNLKP